MLFSNDYRLHTGCDFVDDVSPSIIKFEPLYKREKNDFELQNGYKTN